VQAQVEVTQNQESENVRDIGKVEVRHRKYNMFELGGDHAYDRSSD
jgi:hypothetical protein